MRILLKAVLLILMIVLSLVALGTYVTFYRAMPDYEGEVSVPGIGSQVLVKWDEYQVPHVFADSDDDLYFAVGYIHAQERIWQMTLSQLSSEGRFAEFFGVDWVKYDRHIRTIGIPDISRKIVDGLPADEVGRLEAYARGVNTWVSTNREKLPLEFVLLDVEPIEWEPHHSVGAWRMLGWEMNVSWWAEITYGYLRRRIGEPRWRELLPDYAGTYTPMLDVGTDSLVSDTLRSLTPGLEGAEGAGGATGGGAASTAMAFADVDRSLRSILGSSGSLFGSNAWAISGRKSASGFPMLAGDPHQGLSLPARWYEIHMNRNGQNVAGVTIPGIPYIIMGQNDGMAWNFTNMMADQTDFFEERLLPGTPGFYQSNTPEGIAYQPIRIEREVIRIKDASDEVITIRYTDHGPLINEVYEGQILSDVSLSMRWVGFEPTNELSPLYRLNWIDRFEALRPAVEGFGVPGLNLVYADVGGNIAKLMLARIPVRNYDNVGFAQGWESTHRWTGHIEYDAFPHEINPDTGYVADANQRSDAPFHIGSFNEPDSRYDVIAGALANNPSLTSEQMMALQLETLSDQARELTEAILPVLQRAGAGAQIGDAMNYLLNWDYRYERSATAATIFEVFFMKLAEKSLKDDMGQTGWDAFIRNDQLPLRVVRNMVLNNSRFFDDRDTPAVETRDTMIVRAMTEAVRMLTDSLGTEPINWRWENMHQVSFESPYFANKQSAPKGGYQQLVVTYILNRGPFGVRGHTTSPISGQYRWDAPFRQVAGASWRRVIDLANTAQSWSVIPGGQSGNALSPAYDNQLDLWLDGKYRIFDHNSEVRFREDMTSLTLNPAR